MSSGRSYTTTFKTKAETKGISEMQGKLRDLQKSLSETKREEKELSKEVTAAEKEIAKIQKQIAKTGETTEQQQKDLERLNKTVRDGKEAIEALKLKESQLQTQINETNKKIEDERKALEQLKTSIADAKKYSAELVKEFGALGAAATAAVAGLFAFTRDSAQWADQLNTLSKTTGIGTDELQKFAYASDLIDVSVETMTGSLTKLTRNMQSASENGTSAAAKAFEQLGISVTDASGQLRDRQQVFYEIIDALGRIENVTERDAASMNIFGKSAQELNPLIMGGAQTLKQLGNEAERAGLILDQTTLNGLNEFNDKIDLLKAKGSQIKNLAASEMTPALEGLLEVGDELLNEIKEMAKSGELKKIAKDAGKIIKDGATALKNLIEFVWKYKEAIGAAITAMIAFKVLLTIANLVKSLSSAFTVLTGATNAATVAQAGLNTAMAANPIGAVISLVGALTAGLLSYGFAVNSATQSTSEYLQTLEEAVKQVDKTIASAVGEGEKIKALQAEYDRLRGKVNLTSYEKDKLDTIAKNLADTLGKEVSDLKDATGAYKSLNDEINLYIDNLIKQAKIEAVTNVIKEAASSMYELEVQIEKNNKLIEEGFMGMENALAKANGQYLAEEYNKAKKVMDGAVESLKKLESGYDKLTPSVGNSKKSIVDFSKALEELNQKSSSARSEMSSLASSYDQLNNGQSLSIDTILNLIEKYPEYTDLLIEAANNTDLQRAAVETLFEAKKNEYILAQQAAIDNIRASNLETDTIIQNTNAQIEALNRKAQALSLSTDDARQEKFYKNRAGQLNQIVEGRTAFVASNNAEIARLQNNIDFVQGLTVDSFKSGSSGSSSSRSTTGSGSSGSTGTTDKQLWEMNSHGVYASGETYLKAYTAWIDRMKNLGKMTTEWEVELLEGLLKREGLTADERYEIEYRLYKSREELTAKAEKKQEEALKKQQDRLLEGQKLAKAAFDKLVNDKIDQYEKEAEAAQKAADAEIKAIDDVESRRKQAQEDEKRQKELKAIKARLTYDGHSLTETERYDLERREQEILNDQYESDRARSVEARKAAILSRSEAVQDQSQQAIEGLQAAKTGLSDHLAAVWGTQTYDQRVANNSKTVNISLVNNGLTDDQAAKRIVAKVIKELG